MIYHVRTTRHSHPVSHFTPTLLFFFPLLPIHKHTVLNTLRANTIQTQFDLLFLVSPREPSSSGSHCSGVGYMATYNSPTGFNNALRALVGP